MTTTSWQELRHPSQSATQMAQGIEWCEIIEGTEKQIKFAKDLRNAWLSKITHRDYAANVRWAAQKDRLETLDYSRLAKDAWNRRTITKGLLNTASAKDIIKFFKDVKSQKTENTMIGNYEHIIRFPKQWNFDGKKWVRVSYK